MPRALLLRRTLTVLVLVTASAGVLAPQSAIAAPSWQGPGFQETPIATPAGEPGAGVLSESYVSIYAPLPASDGPHPAACDRIGYLRWRAASGPEDPAQADAIFVAQPGVLEGAGAFDQVARNIVLDALERGYHVEFWGLSRRSNCLIDPTGIDAAIAARDPQLALDYYYDGEPLGGRTFAGFVSEADAQWLSHVGLAQTMQDEFSVISQLPTSFRQTRVLCGGHSLGGPLTWAFANWDFSGTGDPALAGYNQCAGYFSLDSRLELTDSTAQLANPVGVGLDGLSSVVSAALPYVDVPPITPATEFALPLLGMASAWSPAARSTLVAQLPDDPDFNFSLTFLLTDSWSDFLAGIPDPRTLRATNQAVLGNVFSNDTEPIGILRAGLGAPTGGSLVERNFPVPYDSPPILMGLLGDAPLVAFDPADANGSGPLYRWLTYRQITAPLSLPSDPGVPYETPVQAVTDITQLSNDLFASAPALFSEPYFPSRLAIDTADASVGDRSGSLSALRYSDGIVQHPAAYVDAGDGLAPILDPGNHLIPPSPAPLVHVVAPGYHHLDVETAARAQSDGQPELSSSTLASWMEQVVGPPAP
jgi:hypothetical protein